MNPPRPGKPRVALCALSLLAVNIAIAVKLFGVEYSAYNISIEGTFIAIARIMAKYPGQWSWWPFWNGGLPFEVAYLPFSHWIVAAFTLLTGLLGFTLSAARSYHIVSAAIYVASALSVFWMALELSRRLIVSWMAALAYSCISVSALMVPILALDGLGALNLRRLQALVFYGESPHTTALALLPAAIVCFSRALTIPAVKWKILAGVLAAGVVLSNAFGIVVLPVALLCWLMAFPARPWWKRPVTAGAIATVSYGWISPWLSPAMIRAIRANSFTTSGDFRYRAASWVALAAIGAGFLLLWLALRRGKASSHLQFFALFGYVPTAIMMPWSLWNIAVLPQPHRYQLEMDLALLLAIVFAGAAVLDRLSLSVRTAVVAVAGAGLTLQMVHTVVYARDLIRSVEPGQLSEYRIAKWLDQNRPGQRAFISGSDSFLYNAFTDSPQLTGGHDQHTVNTFIPIVSFTIYTGMNAGDRDAEYSIFWLKAFGAHLISVPSPESTTYFNPVAHPHKFDGVLPLLWRDRGDSLYEVPTRSASLAHVIPSSTVVTRTPIHGLDIAPVEPYVAALEDPRYPVATFQWKGMSEADIRATVDRGQVIAVQVTYERGWEAWANGKRLTVRGDAIGQMVIEPERTGPCQIWLRYTGGTERVVTRAMSLAAMLLAAAFAWRERRSACGAGCESAADC
ncbi:MAG TPA: hypothetical protein VNY05_43435 [Candidatus Acidoferrales bacterium]|nr:hypothetical protein [Candidatus Acidoferrales bacterium]